MKIARALTVAALLAGGACGRTEALTPAPSTGAAGAAPLGWDDGDCEEFTMPNPRGAGLPNPSAYTDNGDGTITDGVTGLVWEAAVSDGDRTHDEARADCAAKGAGWRLPTRLELLSLVDYTIPAPGPTIDPIFRDTPGAIFWTSSLYAGDAGDVWNVGFDAGYSDYGISNLPRRVRCVRAPAPQCRPARFTPRDGGLIFDRATGLTWQRTLDPGEYTWDEAARLCAGLGAGWRVPSLTELQTIIDDTKEYPAIDIDAFPDTPSVVFWTSTPRAAGAGNAWYVDFFYGATDADTPSRLYRVRCVR